MTLEKIINIKSIGKKRTVDIEVDNKQHIFYGNGIATSNSHAVSYSILSYQTAYAKAHFPQKFITACFRSANQKIKPKQEIAELVTDCKNNNITVSPPQFCHISKDTKTFYIRDGEIFFGLTDISGVGGSQVDKIIEKIDSEQDKHGIISEWDWNKVLFLLGDQSKTVMENSILSGAFDYLGLDRQRMLYELSLYRDLTKKEKTWISDKGGTLSDKLVAMIESYKEYSNADPKTKKTIKDKKSLSSQARLKKIENILQLLIKPPRILSDSDLVNMNKEKDLLGTNLTVNILSGYNTSVATCTCAEFNSGFEEKEMTICGKIKRVSPYTIKSGKNTGNEMCFVTIEDNTAELDCVVFSSQYENLSSLLYIDNILGFIGNRSDYKNSFVINQTIEI